MRALEMVSGSITNDHCEFRKFLRKSASYLLARVRHQMEELNGALKIMMVHAQAVGDYKAFAVVGKLRESTESVFRLWAGWIGYGRKMTSAEGRVKN